MKDATLSPDRPADEHTTEEAVYVKPTVERLPLTEVVRGGFGASTDGQFFRD